MLDGRLRVLALEPYGGGSHLGFLEAWRDRSDHAWRLLTLPAHSWKWRMRHAAVTFSQRLAAGDDGSEASQPTAREDVLLCSSMLNLAELKGLLPPGRCPPRSVLYFHENQLTYPDPRAGERDLHFAFTQLVSCLAADEVWFNSAFHHDDFLAALPGLLDRMPDHQPRWAVERIAHRSRVAYPGVEADLGPAASSEFGPPLSVHATGSGSSAVPRPLRIGWAARWEHDKNPEALFQALREIERVGVDFELVVLGQSFRRQPPVFAEARRAFSRRIVHWGYLPDRRDYLAQLAGCDVLVSTAHHEFFGIAVIEAMQLGVVPLLPWRLSYPELLSCSRPVCRAEDGCLDLEDDLRGGSGERWAHWCLYSGDVNSLVARLRMLAEWRGSSRWRRLQGAVRARGQDFHWQVRAPALDQELRRVASEARLI